MPIQTPGDCKDQICAADGGVTTQINDSDTPVAGPCEVGMCAAGVPKLAKVPGSPCGDAGTCDWTGMCDPCAMGTSCNNMCLDGTETDIDCGGNLCSQCALGQHCNKDLDCFSNKCDTATSVCVP